MSIRGQDTTPGGPPIPLGWLDSFLLSKLFTIGMNMGTMLILAIIVVHEVATFPGIGARTDVPDWISNQGTVGVLLVALGVVLEGRHTFVVRVKTLHRLGEMKDQDEVTEVCELFGFYVLILGLLAECNGELAKFLDPEKSDLHRLGFCTTSLLLNLVSLGFLVRVNWLVARTKVGWVTSGIAVASPELTSSLETAS